MATSPPSGIDGLTLRITSGSAGNNNRKHTVVYCYAISLILVFVYMTDDNCVILVHVHVYDTITKKPTRICKRIYHK